MSVRIDAEAAVEFLTWWFGEHPEPLSLGLSYQHNGDDSSLDDSPESEDEDSDLEELEPRRKKSNRVVHQHVYTKPAKAIMSTWEHEAPRNHVYFCTTPLLENKPKFTKQNAAGVPGLWVDIDALRDLNINGDEFYAELKDQSEASCWTRSSIQGIQGFFKLEEFFSLTSSAPVVDVDGEEDDPGTNKTKNAIFNEDLKPLLTNIAYFYGGDVGVVSPARLMRLPGSINPKRDNYTCRAQYFDHTFTVANLRKRFKTDENLVPKVVFFAIVKAMERVYGPGSHHDPSVKLFGTCRLMGLDEATCFRLAGELFKFFKSMADDPSPSVASTYARDLDEGLSTLRNDFEEIADEVEKIIKCWVKLKTKYCKKMGIAWKPEFADNPLSDAPLQDGMFQIRSDGIYYLNKDDIPEKFANFTTKILYKVIKIDGKEVDIAEATFRDRRYQFEWTSEKDTSFTKFKTITGLPPKMMVLKEDMWKPFVAWLGEQPVQTYLQESPYYGVLDVEKGKPTLLLPKEPHPEYIWCESPHNTADADYAFKEIGKKQAVDYLTKFGQYYPHYHESTFLWSALGWFAATPFAAFTRHTYKGFPVLMVSGLGESGKTFVTKYVLGMHMGCQPAQMYKATTQFARRKALSSNNIIPLLVDEFRDDDEMKTSQMLDLIRNLWDQGTRKAGMADGSVSVDHLVGTLCLIGEHQYQDEATLHRTFSIRVGRDYLTSLADLRNKDDVDSKAEVARLAEGQAWLENDAHKGVLGALIIRWMQEHMEEVPKLLEKSKAIIDGCHDTHKLRNAIGLSIVIFGLLIIKRLYKDYGVEFPVDGETMMAAVFEADAAVNASTVYGAANLKTLFQVTDNVIISELRREQTLQGYIYAFDPEEPDIMYFDMGRWHDSVSKFMRGTASATLINKTAFFDLLHVSMKNPDSPILGFPEDNPVFQKGCIMVDIKKVQDQFAINVRQWTIPRDIDAT